MTMRCGVFTDGLAHLSLEAAAAWCAERDVGELELGVGGYSPAPHLDLTRLLAEPAARDELERTVAGARCRISALNASGNPLHPDPVTSVPHDAALRGAIRLAVLLGVETVVAMSGCPGAPGGGGWPVFAGGAWLPDMEGLWEWQWQEKIAPYWEELSAWAGREAPGVRICLELHPGTSVYNPESYRALREVTGDNVLVNLDPSHFWWQGIDPVQAIGRLDGCIGFAHGKDTTVHADRVEQNGVLDFLWPSADPATRAWHFSAVGAGHDEVSWLALVAALRQAGYDGVVSVEHEDPLLGNEEGIDASLAALARVV
jgi:sugar phosphate isomerase/epimerase